MPSPNGDAREFEVETNFQRAARRPGGIPRAKALQNAEVRIEQIKPTFALWLDNELAELRRDEAINLKDPAWIDAVECVSHRLADVATTIDYQFVSFVANNFGMICEAIKAGAECPAEIIICHLNALLLGSQQRYRKTAPQDLPELSDGLRRVLKSKQLTSRSDVKPIGSSVWAVVAIS